MDHAENLVAFGNHQRRASRIGDAVSDAFDLRAHCAAHLADEADNRIDRAFADDAAVQIATAHACLGAERNKFRADALHVATAQSVFLLRQHDDRAAFRSFIGETRELGGVRESFRRSRHRQ